MVDAACSTESTVLHVRSVRNAFRARLDRMSRVWCLCALATLAVFCFSSSGLTQEKTDSVERADGAFQSTILDDNGMLNLDYRLEILDPDGTPVLVNVTLEELRELKSQAAISSQLPDAIFTSIEVDATVDGQLAMVEGRFEVQLGASQNPARIGLRFDSCMLTEAATWTNDEKQGRMRVVESGYEWLLRGEENERCALTLRGKSVVQRKSDRQTLSINLPVAITTVNVLLPKSAVEIRARAEDLMDTPTTTEEGVRVVVNSRGGSFSLSWREQGAVKRISSIEAKSNTVFDIIDPHELWQATTELNVRWYGNDSSNEFEIQLPPQAQWREYPNPADERFRVSAVEASPERAVEPGGLQSQRLLVKKFDASQTDSVKLMLIWDWIPNAAAEGKPGDETETRLLIPRIEGVDEHSGTVSCNFPASYSAVFKEGPGAKLDQQVRLANAFGQRQMQFRFDQQDFELAMTFRQEQSLPTVRPIYRVNIDQNKLVLTAWLNCSFDANGQPLEIGIIPGDWIFEENTAQILKVTDSPFESESELLAVKRTIDGSYIFNGGESDSGLGNVRRIEQVWRIVAQRSWNPDDNNALQFQIPGIIRYQPNGATEIDHASGVLLVASADNVLSIWNQTASTGLLPDSFSNEYKSYIPNITVREPLAYRFQSRGTTPNWAGVAEFLPQQVSFDQQCDLAVLSNEIQVQQAFVLRVANEPLANLQIAIREDADTAPQAYVNGNLTLLQLGETISLNELQAMRNTASEAAAGTEDLPEDAPLASDKEPLTSDKEPLTSDKEPLTSDKELRWRLYRLVGAPNLIGSASVSILSKVPFALPSTNVGQGDADDTLRDSSKLGVPIAQLLLPPGTQSIRQDWGLQSEMEIEVIASLADGKLESLTQSERRLTLSGQTHELNLEIRKREVAALSQVAIKDSLLQSVIAGDKRRDRYIARVQASSGRISIRLPKMVGEPERVAVDGQQSDAPYDYNSKTLSISLPEEPIAQEHVIELFYLIDDSLAWLTPIHAEVPQIDGADYQGRFFWQLVTPPDKHLAWCPSGLTAEWIWKWSGLWWYRAGEQDQASLERWLGSSVQARQPLSANSYIMSGQGVVVPQDVWILSRLVLWLPMGSVAIAFSISVLAIPWLRRPATAIVLAIGILSLAMVWPDLAVLFGQTAVLSLSLVVLIWITQAAIDTRVRRRSVFTSRPSTYLDGSDHFSVGRGTRVAPPLMQAGSSVAQAGEK
jgi:hypothetical protein